MMDNFFEAMKDSDWGESVTDLDFNTHSQEMLNDCERAVKREPELEYDMVVRKSWAEYAKEIKRLCKLRDCAKAMEKVTRL